ncbi:MAG: hypothetical protein R3324_01135 [Halobacteriales archaeon]|nr:hypothetical protein [Halobacteriales archaeon]
MARSIGGVGPLPLVLGSIVVGTSFIILQNTLLTTIGILLTIIGLMALMPLVKVSLLEQPAR